LKLRFRSDIIKNRNRPFSKENGKGEIMRYNLLPKEGTFYKANLHTHSTITDGKLTPEQIKEEYKKQGYSIVAYTDHEIMIPHNDLTDDTFLAITAAEASVKKETPATEKAAIEKTYHFCLYAKDKTKTVYPIFTEKKVPAPHTRALLTEEMLQTDYSFDYDIESVNKAIALCNEQGFLVSYNHPVWSLQNYTDYANLKGVWGIECYNHGSWISGRPDTVVPFDDLLRQGERVFPLATDDAHTIRDMFGGFVMIKATALEYDTIMTALEKGDFYASTGPQIHELYLEDDVLHVSCSPAVEIMITTADRYTPSTRGYNRLHTEADINLSLCKKFAEDELAHTDMKPYFRVTVRDEHGNCAYSPPYFRYEF
jgi:hypothetical protein